MIVRWLWPGAAAIFLASTPAVGCRVPVRADIVVYGELVSPPRNCPGCGPRIRAIKVIRGAKQKHFQLPPPGTLEVSCYSRTKRIGDNGVFGLLGNGPIFSQLYFSAHRPADWADTFQ